MNNEYYLTIATDVNIHLFFEIIHKEINDKYY